MDDIPGFLQGGRIARVNQGGESQLMEQDIYFFDVMSGNLLLQFGDDSKDRRAVKLSRVSRQDDSGFEFVELGHQACLLLGIVKFCKHIPYAGYLLIRQLIGRKGIFHAVKQDNLPFDILDDVEHKVNFAFAYHMGIGIPKAINDLRGILFFGKLLPGIPFQQRQQMPHMVGILVIEVEEKAVIELVNFV
jgi:hypothetical protein